MRKLILLLAALRPGSFTISLGLLSVVHEAYQGTYPCSFHLVLGEMAPTLQLLFPTSPPARPQQFEDYSSTQLSRSDFSWAWNGLTPHCLTPCNPGVTSAMEPRLETINFLIPYLGYIRLPAQSNRKT